LIVFAPSVSAKPKVAVLGLEVTGTMDQKASEAAKVLTRELRREANKSGGAFDLAPNSGKDLLEMKLLSDCSDEGRRCMSDIGKQLRADRLIYGHLQRGKRGFTVELRLLDTEKADLVREVEEVIPASEASAAGALTRRARALYGQLTGAGEEGALAITAITDEGSVERGTVFVDGEIRTSLSAGSARVSGLSQGTHRVAIEARGFDRYETEVNIKAGESRSLKANLVAVEMADAELGGEGDVRPGRGWRIAVWGGVLAGIGTGAGWAYSGVTVSNTEKDLDAATLAYGGLNSPEDPNAVSPKGMADQLKYHCEDFETGGETAPGDPRSAHVTEIRDLCDKGPRHRNLVNLVWIPATAAAVLFTSFAVYKGYIAPGKMTPSERAAARKKRNKRRVTVMPAIGPNLVGAGLELQF
jgi:hypothetical protein